MLRKRTLAGSTPGPTDFLAEYEYEDGQIKSESYYGGDTPGHGLPPGPLFSMALDPAKQNDE